MRSIGSTDPARTCGPIIESFVQALDERPDLPPVQIVGGNASAALLDEQTVIDLDNCVIRAPAGCDLPAHRTDGSLRDLDVLVLSNDVTEIEAVRLLAEQSTGDRLKASVFGLKTLADLESQRSRPLRSTARVFLGDRYVAGRGPTSFHGFKSLYPFQVPIAAETMATFTLCIEGRVPSPTSHPGTTILNYLTRSISGVRAKDRTKVEAMTSTVLTRCPEIKAWLLDGPGQELFDLARILHTLSQPRSDARVRQLGTQLEIVPYDLDELDQHGGFMASERSRTVRRLLIESAHVKSRLLARFEAQAAIVTFWQKHIEDRIDPIIHNDS